MLSSCGTVVVMVVSLVVLQTSSAQESADRIQPCPKIRCLLDCRLITGKDGCQTCFCPSCEDFKCDTGYVCELQYIDCHLKKPCYREPTCVLAPEPTTPCPQIRCAPGWVSTTGKDGCQTCVRLPSCEDIKCEPGYVCELQKVECFTEPCYPQPTCVPVKEPTTPCPLIRCAPGWVSTTGKDGCQTCVRLPSCEDIKCEPGYVCELQKVECFTEPCYPQPTCVPVKEPTTPCPLIRCAPGWVSTTGKDGCQTCVRLPSCEDIKCEPGYVCELQKVECFTEPCYPQPTCVPVKVECIPPRCKMLCAYGFKRDKNGCELCECLDKPSS